MKTAAASPASLFWPAVLIGFWLGLVFASYSKTCTCLQTPTGAYDVRIGTVTVDEYYTDAGVDE